MAASLEPAFPAVGASFPSLTAFVEAVRAAHRTASSSDTAASTSSGGEDDSVLAVQEYEDGTGATVTCKLSGEYGAGRMAVNSSETEEELCHFAVFAQAQDIADPSRAFTVTASFPHSSAAHHAANLPLPLRLVESDSPLEAQRLSPTGASQVSARKPSPVMDGHFTSSSRADDQTAPPSSGGATPSQDEAPQRFIVPLLPPSNARSGRKQKRGRSQVDRTHEEDVDWIVWGYALGELDDDAEQAEKRRKVEHEKVSRMGGKGALRSWGWWAGEVSEGSEVDAELDAAPETTMEDSDIARVVQVDSLTSSSTPEREDSDDDFTPLAPPAPRRSSGRGRGGRGRGRGRGRAKKARIPSSPAMSTRTTRRNALELSELRELQQEPDGEQAANGDDASHPAFSTSPRPLTPTSPIRLYPIIDAAPWSTPDHQASFLVGNPFPFPHLPTCLFSPAPPHPQVNAPRSESRALPPIRSFDNAFLSSPSSPASPSNAFAFSPNLSLTSGSPDTLVTSSFSGSPVLNDAPLGEAFSVEPKPASPPKRRVCPPPPPPFSSPENALQLSVKVSQKPTLPVVAEDDLEEGEVRETGALPSDEASNAREADVLAALLELRHSPRSDRLGDTGAWHDEWAALPASPTESTASPFSSNPAPSPPSFPPSDPASPSSERSAFSSPSAHFPSFASSAADFSLSSPSLPRPTMADAAPSSQNASASALSFRPRVSVSVSSSGARRPSGASSKAQAVALASARQAKMGGVAELRDAVSEEQLGADDVAHLREQLWSERGEREGVPFDPLYAPTLLSVKLSRLASDRSFVAPPVLSLPSASSFLQLLANLPKPSRARLPALQSVPTVLASASVRAQLADPRVLLALEYLYNRRLSEGECAFLEKREKAFWVLVRFMAAVAEVNERSRQESGSRGGGRGWLRRG
ncbi:hypothetical protein JCM10213_002251 [Rhodosporidiobolus nylandii]